MPNSWPSLSERRAALSRGLFVIVLMIQTAARAQGYGTAPVGPDSPAPAPEALTPPSLKVHPDAPYPAEGLQQRVEGNVGLEIDIDAAGAVVGVRVTTPAGHGFDESATEAARRFTFEPATRNGVAIPSTVQFTYEFHLPPEPPPAPPPPPLPPAPAPQAHTASEAVQTGPNQSTLVLASKPISAASSFSVQDRDFQLRPIGSVQDILRVTPGLVVVQHSGGGKANQYFLRGFDADHGTDLALSIDGVPINMVAHAHGQGFADTNFIIPEVVERVEITKGPYFANQGDFATAGAVNLVSRDEFEHSSAGAGLVGAPGHGSAGYRGLVIASPTFERSPVKATFAAEIGRSNGPFDNPEDWDKYKLFNKLTFSPTPVSSLSLTEMSYAGNWHGSGQIPARAVDQGLISRFGSIDPDEGGNTARHQLALQYRLHPTETSDFRVLAYAGTYRFNLFSNFTLYLRDPDNGDEIEQIDRRVFYGAKMSYRVLHRLGSVTFDTTIGADARDDDIHEELWDTLHRQPISAVRSNDVHESFVGAYFNEEITPARWIRAEVGGRADLLSFAVDNRLASTDPTAPQSGIDAAHQLSPKASLIVTPLDRPGAQLDVYVNYGHGFHSNDVRGVFAQPVVTPLARAKGEEIGARTRLLDRLDLGVAFWQLDLASETVWNGDDGTTGVSDPTNRKGIEVESRYEVTPWLAADLALTFTKSQFTTDMENGGGLALAPKRTWAGGLSGRHALGPGVARAGLRFYGIGDRPATDDGALTAPGFTQFDMHLGYRHRRFDIAVDIENLLNGAFRSAQFATVSRLRNEPAVGAATPAGFGCGNHARLAIAPDGSPANGRFYGCEDVNYTPAYPLTVRLMATLFLD
jgi:TonB family protein